MADFDTTKNQLGTFVQRYVEYVTRILTNAKGFFAQKTDERGFLEPTLFAIISILLPRLVYAIMLAPITFGVSIIWILPSVVYQLGLLVIAAVLLFAMIRLMGGEGDFEAAYRSVAYASVSSLVWLIPIPFVNLLLSVALFGFLLFHALQETHNLNSQQAVIALMVPALLTLAIGLIVTFSFAFFLIKGMLLLIGLG